MKDKAEIQLNYRRTLKQADELEEMARQLASLAVHKGENAVQNIQQSWNGESANSYYRKGQRITLLMKQQSDSLMKTASVLRKAANNTYYAEMKSIEIAEKRRYGT